MVLRLTESIHHSNRWKESCDNSVKPLPATVCLHMLLSNMVQAINMSSTPCPPTEPCHRHRCCFTVQCCNSYTPTRPPFAGVSVFEFATKTRRALTQPVTTQKAPTSCTCQAPGWCWGQQQPQPAAWPCKLNFVTANPLLAVVLLNRASRCQSQSMHPLDNYSKATDTRRCPMLGTKCCVHGRDERGNVHPERPVDCLGAACLSGRMVNTAVLQLYFRKYSPTEPSSPNTEAGGIECGIQTLTENEERHRNQRSSGRLSWLHANPIELPNQSYNTVDGWPWLYFSSPAAARFAIRLECAGKMEQRGCSHGFQLSNNP